MIRSFFPSVILFTLLSSLQAAPETAPGLITKEEVQKSLQEHAAAWQEKIKQNSPRLFFNAQQWTQVQKEIENMPPYRAANLPLFFAEIDGIVALPLPVYETPEGMVGKRGDATTVYSAQEELWEREIGDQIFSLALAVRLKPEPAYQKKLHDLVMAAIGFETWGRNKPPMGNNSDLSAGHVGRGIATAYDWHKNLFSDDEKKKIREVVTARMNNLLGGLYGNAFWARGYEENHNQVSVSALGFCGIAFYDEIPEAPEWLAASRLDFENVGRAVAADGSSVEGISYWNYGISYILQYIEATRQIIDSADLYKTGYLKSAAAYRLMGATSGLVGNIPWGDAVTKDWSPPHAILYKLAAEYQDGDAGWFADHLAPPKGGALNILWARNAPVSGSGPQNLDTRLLVNDLVASRTGWDAKDYLVSFKGGFTNRNHSHLDAGSLGIAFGNEWVLTAPGYGKGAHEGEFWQRSGTRWEYFSNATESHSTLLINGKNQDFSDTARGTITGFFSSPSWTWSHMDLSKAYLDVKNVSREILHRRGDYILVFDDVTADKPVTVEWLSQFRKDPVQEDGSLLVSGDNGKIRLKMLIPSTPFSLRQPTSKKVDNNKPQFTYAVKESGTHVNYAALLQPMSGTVAKAPLQIQMEPMEGVIHSKISGDGWTDSVIKADHSQLLNFTATANGVDAKITGQLAAIRTMPGGIQSLLALDATVVQLAGLSFTFKTPVDIAAEKTAAGWQVTTNRDISGEVTVPAGQNIRFALSSPEGKITHVAK